MTNTTANNVLTVAKETQAPAMQISHRRRMWRKFYRNPRSVFGVFLVLLVTFSAVFAPYVSSQDPLKQRLLDRFEKPYLFGGKNARYILGSDQVGRDIFSRLIYGTRISLIVGVLAVALGGTLGVSLGLISGYFGGRTDLVIMTLVDLMMGMPLLILALAVMAVLGPGFWNLIFVLAVTGWQQFTRVVRAETLALREREFVGAAQALGAGTLRIVLRHVLPNTFSPIIVIGTLRVAITIQVEAILSFLGFSTGGDIDSWGMMVAIGREVITVAWWPSTFPGLAILITVLGFNLMGDAARDVLDPRIQ